MAGEKRKCDRMNRVILMGRLTRDPEVRYSQGERSMAIARYTLAVDRRGRRNQDSSAEQQTADFINCVASVSYTHLTLPTIYSV